MFPEAKVTKIYCLAYDFYKEFANINKDTCCLLSKK